MIRVFHGSNFSMGKVFKHKLTNFYLHARKRIVRKKQYFVQYSLKTRLKGLI